MTYNVLMETLNPTHSLTLLLLQLLLRPLKSSSSRQPRWDATGLSKGFWVRWRVDGGCKWTMKHVQTAPSSSKLGITSRPPIYQVR